MQNVRHPKTHRELCELACRFLRNHGFKVVFSDRFHAWTSCGEHPDALGFRNGASCLIEVKCSRSDFLADRKKVFRAEPEKGMGDWRFYLCEPGVITVDDLPTGWGLLYAINGRVRKVHGWPGNHQWVVTVESKRLARTVLIFTERSDQLSRATDRVPGLPASPGYAQ